MDRQEKNIYCKKEKEKRKEKNNLAMKLIITLFNPNLVIVEIQTSDLHNKFITV